MLIRYLEGELSVEETQQLEQVVAEDPFMADALEGLRTMPEPSRAQAIGQELKFKAHKLLRAKRPIVSLFDFNQYATAAVAVLVILFVATAAILLTSRLQESPSAEKTFTENVIENPQGKITENFSIEPGAVFIPENNNFKPEPTPPKTEIEKEPKVDIANNTSPTPAPESTQPTNEQKETTTATPPVEELFADEKVAEDEEIWPEVGNAVTVESYQEIPNDPTLSKDQLDPYKQALTEGEYTSYKQALTKLENSLVAVADKVVVATKDNVSELSTRTSVPQNMKEFEREERKQTREQERKAKKRAEKAYTDSRINDSAAKKEDLVDRDRRDQGTTADDAAGVDYFEVNENLLKQQLYTDPTNGENWLTLGQYYLEQNQYIKAELYLKGAASSGKLSVVQEANKLLEAIEGNKKD